MGAVAVLMGVSMALAWESASTTAVGKSLTIQGEDGSALHTHGGDPARLANALFKVTIGERGPVKITVTEVAYVTSHNCDVAPAKIRSKPMFGGIWVAGAKPEKSSREITLQPKSEQVVSVEFTAVEAYYTHCDRFAFRVSFAVDDEPLVVVAETNISRIDGLDP